MPSFWSLWPLRTSHRPAGRNARCRRPRLAAEPLEDRTVPAVSVLNGGGSGYAGLNFGDSGGYVPPDTCGAAGPTGYVETVNQAVALYDKADGTRLASDSLSHFLFSVGGLSHADSGSGLSDPIVAYDELAGRFVIGDQDVNFSTHVSTFDLAVSKTANPASLTAADWTFYRITTTESGFDADYPGNFGYNRDGLVLTLNMFGVTSGGHVQVVSVDANDLANGVAAANLHVYKNDLADFNLRPTAMHDSAAGDPMWLVTEHGDGQSVDVIRMTSPNGTVLSNSASFAYTNLAVSSYSDAVPPLNPGGTVITDNVDSRIINAAEAGGVIVAAHSVSVSPTQDVAQWYAIDVSGGTPALAQQGRVGAGNNTYVSYPGIDINPSGQIGMSYMRSGTDAAGDFLSVWVSGRTPSDPSGSMESPVLVPAGAGQAKYKDFTSGGRAGDLSGINVDPTDGTFWAANEFADSEATANWGTAVANFAIDAPAGSADLAVGVTGPSSVTAGTRATYTVTVTNNGPDAAGNVALTDLLPAGSVFVSATAAGTNPDAFSFGQSNGTVTGTAGTVGSGHTDVFTLVVSAPASLPNGADFSDRVSVAGGTADGDAGNNSASVTGSVVNTGPSADLAVAFAAFPVTAAEGANLVYTLTVTNTGPSAASGVVLTDTLGANLGYVSATTTAGTVSHAGAAVTVSIGTLAAGGSVTVKVTARALEDGSLTDSAAVAGSVSDPAAGNNSAVATTAVSEPPIVVSAPLTTRSRSLSNATVATFTHAGGVEPASAFAATITWGDGTTSAGTVVQRSNGTYAVLGSHVYRSGGRYTITTRVVEAADGADVLLIDKVGDDGPELPARYRGDGRSSPRVHGSGDTNPEGLPVLARTVAVDPWQV